MDILSGYHGALAHLARALRWQRRGDQFESGMLHHIFGATRRDMLCRCPITMGTDQLVIVGATNTRSINWRDSYGDIAQLIERSIRIAEAGGSTPPYSTIWGYSSVD